MNLNKSAILGAGTWGVALGYMLAKDGKEVVVWSALSDEITALRATRRQKNLPDTELPESITFTEDLALAVGDASFVLFAVPSVFVRATARLAAPLLNEGQVVIDVAKGIEQESLCFLSEIIDGELRAVGRRLPIVALSGPTHAEEVARDLPTVIVAASTDVRAARAVQDFFMNTCLRVYTATDVHGVELCGALKNIVAIAAGVSAGLGFGDNTKAAVIRLGLMEMIAFAKLFCSGTVSSATFLESCGVADLITTCYGGRNRKVAEAFARTGKSIEQLEKEMLNGQKLQGPQTARELHSILQHKGLVDKFPLFTAVYKVCYEGQPVGEFIRCLQNHPEHM